MTKKELEELHKKIDKLQNTVDKKDKDKYMRQGWDLAEKQIQKEDKEVHKISNVPT